jgi:hypothetical protein
MTISVPVYPLSWPEGRKRNPNPSASRPFKTSLNVAIQNVRGSLRRFGEDTGIKIAEDSIVFSSNYGGVGLEMRQSNPKDTGVAVWFEWDAGLRCIPVDRYSDLAQNVQAIHHLIEADRTKMRYGGLEIVRAAYKGYTALPAPKSRLQWWQVLGLPNGTRLSKAGLEAAYRARAKVVHPDAGGSREAWDELEAARAEALAHTDG